jgi:hypothetical protein
MTMGQMGFYNQLQVCGLPVLGGVYNSTVYSLTPSTSNQGGWKMSDSNKYSKLPARWAGICLLGALAGLAITLSVIPSFDARPEYFAGWLPGLVNQRLQYGIALGLALLTGGITLASGFAVHQAFRRAGNSGVVPGVLLVATGAGFILSALLGVPLLRILFEAAIQPVSNWNSFAGEAYPWASANQFTMIVLGLGSFAAGLLATAVSLILAGGISVQTALLLALVPLAPLVIFLILPGEDPVFLLVLGIPILAWSIALGGYLAITGRVTQAFLPEQ